MSNLDLQKVGILASISSLPRPPFTSFLSHPPLFVQEKEKRFFHCISPPSAEYCLNKPIVLDVSEQSALVTLEQVEQGIKNGGRLLLLGETFGFIPDFDAFANLGIPIIEDISQSIGGEYNEKKVGTLGVFSILGLESNDLVTAGGGAYA